MTPAQPQLVVAGCTRSGLTMTMQMLHAGGYPCLGQPRGFEPFECGAVPWDLVAGRAVKLVDADRQMPPPGAYRVIRPRRQFRSQAASINKVNGAMGLPAAPLPALKSSLKKSYRVIDPWMRRHPHLVLDFEDVLANPMDVAVALRHFVDADLDVDRMAAAVVPRGPHCLPYLLELKQARATTGEFE